MIQDHLNIRAATRILIEADLQPVQGTRFQPTGFPSLGASVFRGPRESDMLLVESAQSIANRLESTIWDSSADDLEAVFQGLPYVSTTIGARTTDSIREAHRLNSPYLIGGIRESLAERAGIAGRKTKGKVAADDEDADESPAVDIRKLARAVFFYDPNCVLHGVFLEKIVGSARLTRALSGFIEATNVRPAESGGVKNDRVDISGKSLGGAEKGFGNVPYSRTEYTADSITAFFSIDIALLRSYALGEAAENLLIAIALWKIQTFLQSGMRLRSACDFEVIDGARMTRPTGQTIPSLDELSGSIRFGIETCGKTGLFADPPKTIVSFEAKSK